MSKGSDDIETLQAKIVVLGDNKTGKTSLIRALDPYSKNMNQTGSSGEQTSFTVIEIPSNELDYVVNVFLKFWEYGFTSSKKEQEVAFPGALFCIITFDMRAPETANSAFNQWMQLKELHMSESFLFVIGTFLDQVSQRRVEISEICKACAQKEAIYIEVSNLDGSNINLLRRLICQRLNQMLKIREEQKHASTIIGRSPNETKSNDQTTSFSEESKALPPTELIIDSITPSLLEKNILSHSIGGIYTSTFYATTSDNEWMGFEREKQNIIHVGQRISNYIDQISHGLQIPPPSDDYRPTSNTSTSLSEPDADEVRHLFDLMGLPLPPSLQITKNAHYPTKKATVKMKVRLPDGSQANLVLRSGDNIEQVVYQFLVNHDMKEGNSLDRLIDIGTAMLKRAEEQESAQNEDFNTERDDDFMTTTGTISQYDERTEMTTQTQSTSPKKLSSKGQSKLRKCKARIKLPNNQVSLLHLRFLTCNRHSKQSLQKAKMP